MVKIKDPSTKKTEVNTVSIGPSKPNSNDYKEIKEEDAVVIGISKDTLASHEKFKEKQKLPFDVRNCKNH